MSAKLELLILKLQWAICHNRPFDPGILNAAYWYNLGRLEERKEWEKKEGK